ncbi:MAG: DUF1700 domain-containing protein [Clostridia bacterium]|nr:DUF1700 domain-containing protein [Clostridia bacterium]
MTYNEWRDELKSNLLCVSEQERVRVLDYYAEAYADRRDAGYSEREITAEFGAPYDAAQRILAESSEQFSIDTSSGEKSEQPYDQGYGECVVQPTDNTEQYSTQSAQQRASNKTWIFALLCVIFAIPIFGIIMAMVGVTIGFCVTPCALLIAGIGAIGEGVVALFSDYTLGAVMIGLGLVIFGLSIMIMPIFFKLVKLMWKLFGRFFAWLKSLFNGKEK